MKIITYDKGVLEVSKDIVVRSEFIRHMIEDCVEDELEINLLNSYCTLEIMNRIIEFMRMARDEYEDRLMELDILEVKRIAKACDFLDIKPLLEAACNVIVRLIKECKSSEDLKERFKITREFNEGECKRLEEFFKLIT